jgi:hypothetical protein
MSAWVFVNSMSAYAAASPELREEYRLGLLKVSAAALGRWPDQPWMSDRVAELYRHGMALRYSPAWLSRRLEVYMVDRVGR